MREVQRERSPAVTWHPLETVNRVHMYTFPTTIPQKLLKQPEPFIHCSASQAHSSAFGRWYLGFWRTYRFMHRYGFLNHRPEVLLWKRRSSPENVFLLGCRTRPHGETRGKEWDKLDLDSKRLCSVYTHTGCFLCPCFPSFGNQGSPRVLESDS